MGWFGVLAVPRVNRHRFDWIHPPSYMADNNHYISHNDFADESIIQQQRTLYTASITALEYAVQHDGIPYDPGGHPYLLNPDVSGW